MKTTTAFIKKEFLQIIRDPSSLLIAFVLPLVLLFIYTYGINLDFAHVRLGIKNDDRGPQTADLIDALGQNAYMQTAFYGSEKQMYHDLARGKIQGALTLPADTWAALTICLEKPKEQKTKLIISPATGM